jgi:tripartite-type tricarboxylate transporter receptor subunit TctC
VSQKVRTTTSAEAGFPALVADNSYALFAPAGTPTPILTRLHDATVAVLALPEVRDQLREQGAEVIGSAEGSSTRSVGVNPAATPATKPSVIGVENC